jgi:hypothetical protein
MGCRILSMRTMVFAWAFVAQTSFVRADGGAIRLSEQKEGYRITVFTSPTPVRAGAVDISVLVQDAESHDVASDVEVTIRVEGPASARPSVERRATTEVATNKLYRAATVELSESGWYTVSIAVKGSRANAQFHFELEAARPLPSWMTLSPWVGWPVLAIALFAGHQILVRKRARTVQQRLSASNRSSAAQ